MQTIREEVVGFHLCEKGTSGRAIKTVITNAVADLGLRLLLTFWGAFREIFRKRVIFRKTPANYISPKR